MPMRAPPGPAVAPRVFTVPPDVAFLPHLAGAILSGNLPVPGAGTPRREDLPAWTILVPTRRAARTLATAFLEAAGGQAMLLPRIRPLGDVDEEDLVVAEEGWPGFNAGLPPAMPGIEREFHLARLILDWAAKHPDQPLATTLAGARARAFSLAASLAGLIDSFETEGVGLAEIAALFDLDLPRHREMVLDFLAIVEVELPAVMARCGMIGEKERRSRLIAAEARRLEAAPPAHPLIAAGSTGSIPATARLLAAVARLPLGAVVLPGLDQELDAESWQALSQQHPQFGLRQLLAAVGIDRSEVALLPGIARSPAGEARALLASEIMRPAETTERWAGFMRQPDLVRAAVDGLTLIAAADQRGEAVAIALALRGVLETPGQTAALVTPDRELARRVKGELARWGVGVDDSAGEPLGLTPAGQFALVLMDAARPEASPVDLMALLDHRLAAFATPRPITARAARSLDLLLRGQAGLAGHAGILAAIRGDRAPAWQRHAHPAQRHMTGDEFAAAVQLATALEAVLKDLGALLGDHGLHELDELLALHLKALEAAHASSEDEAGTTLWTGEDGEALAGMFLALRQHAHTCPPITPQDYRGLIAQMLARVPVRQRAVEHPRLAILGLLEARLVRPDVVILGGLAEGTWPGEAMADPWLNRPQRARIDLPLPERRIGLQAHDFAQGLGTGRVIVTWASRRADAPANPSRWLTRLKVLTTAAGLDGAMAGEAPWLAWAERLDRPAAVRPVAWPVPRPPVAGRPVSLSVTRIDDLAEDPYRIFARSILGLHPLDPLIKPVGAAERGTLIHAALNRFVSDHPGALGPQADAQLMAEFDRQLAATVVDAALAAMLRPRLQRIASWFVDEERGLRRDVTGQFTEIEGRLEIEAGGRRYRLTARADRIDVLADGGARLIDYKSGSLPSLNPDARTYSRQLDLEAAMIAAGAFEPVGARPVSQMGYMALKGSLAPGQWKPKADDVAAAADQALAECRALFVAFAQPDTPYIAADWSDEPGSERDYGQLSRWREWGQGRGRNEAGDD
jgi:ATP-dependent helicase/nuclease subunit B